MTIATLKTPFYDVTNPSFGLRELADRLVTERLDRYAAEIDRLLSRALRFGWADEAAALEEELAVVRAGDATAVHSRTSGSSQLQRARLSFVRDVEMIRWHVPEYRPLRSGEPSPSLAKRVRALVRALLGSRGKTLVAEPAADWINAL